MNARVLLLSLLACACRAAPVPRESSPDSAAGSAIPAPAIAKPQPSPAESAFEEARAASRAGHDEEARAILRRALSVALAEGSSGASAASARTIGRLAARALSLGDAALALDGFRGEIAILERDPALDPNLLVLARGDMAEALRRTGDCAGAKRIQEELIAALELSVPRDDPTLLIARSNLSLSLACLGDLPAERQLLEDLLAIEEAVEPPVEADLRWTRTQLAEACRMLGDLPRARTLAAQGLAALERTVPPDDVELQLARNGLATVIAAQGDRAGARALLEPALAVLEKRLPPDHPHIQALRLNLANLRTDDGELHGAATLLRHVIETLERTTPPDSFQLGIARLNLGGLLRSLGDIDGGLVLTQQARATFERTLPAEHPSLLTARENEALMLSSLGDPLRARAILEDVIRIRERTRPASDPDLQEARTRLAGSLYRLGDLTGARSLFEGALAELERTFPPDDLRLQTIRSCLASVLFASNDFEAVKSLAEPALERQEVALPPDDLRLQRTRICLGLALEGLGDLDGAHTLFAQAVLVLDGILSAGDPDSIAAHTNLGVLAVRREDLGTARAEFEKVLRDALAARPPDEPFVQTARANLAWALAKTGDVAGSSALVREILSAYRRALASALPSSWREAGEIVQAAERNVSVVLELSTQPDAPAELGRGAFELVETLRALAAGTAIAAGPGATDPELVALQREVRERSGEIRDRTSALSRADVDHARAASELAQSVRALDQAERKVGEALSRRGLGTRPVELAALARALPRGSAAVGYRRTGVPRQSPGSGAEQERLIAQVVASDGSLTRVEIGRLDAVEAAIADWRAAVGESLGRGRAAAATGVAAAPEAARAGEALRALVLDPVRRAAGDVATLYVCPDENLFLIPLDALPDREGRSGEDRVVGDTLAIRTEVSFARLLHGTTITDGPPTLLALGGIEFDAPGADESRATSAALPPVEFERGPGSAVLFAPLARTRAEVDEIGAIFGRTFHHPGQVVVGAEATRQFFESAAPAARFIHLATHGYFAGDRVRSSSDAASSHAGWRPALPDEVVVGMAPMCLCGLALAGANREPTPGDSAPGILTAEELARIDLSRCELAVLSACETNVGIRRAGQGIRSLQSALLAAGARSTLTSLWKVGDEPARELMAEFYRRIWELGEPKARALWNAKTRLRERGAPTREWAGWVLFGDPD